MLASALLGGAAATVGSCGGPTPPPDWPAAAPGADVDDAPSAARAFGWGAPAWSDTFDGSAPGPAWQLYDSAGHDDNGVRSPAQVTVADGVLTQEGTADARSAGMVRTGEARYGRWEVRARADQAGSGSRPYHAVIALIPVDVPYADGERDIDFAEADVGTGEVSLFVHHPPRRQAYLSIPLDLAQWHTFAIESAPSHVTWFVDGVPRATTTRTQAVPTTPLALNVQLDAYGDDLVPARLQVDWARHYALPAPDVAAPPAPEPAEGDYDPGS